jgi:hypothetical protein
VREHGLEASYDTLRRYATQELDWRRKAPTVRLDDPPPEAGLEPAMRLECWDKTAKVSFDKRMLAELGSLRCVGGA